MRELPTSHCPPGYRELRPGEIILRGDVMWDRVDHPYTHAALDVTCPYMPGHHNLGRYRKILTADMPREYE